MDFKKLQDALKNIETFNMPEIPVVPNIKDNIDWDKVEFINQDILDELKKNNEQLREANIQQTIIITKQHRTNVRLTWTLIILGVLTLFVAIYSAVQTNKNNTLTRELELLKVDSKEKSLSISRLSDKLDELRDQVLTFEQRNKRLTQPISKNDKTIK